MGMKQKVILLGLCIVLFLSLGLPCNALDTENGIVALAEERLEVLYVAFPDLTLTREDIQYMEDVATISATIQNAGTADATNIVVQFYDGDPEVGGVQIDADQTISSIPAGDTGSAQVAWTATSGTHNIFVLIDPYKSIEEVNENNNQAYKPIMIEPGQLPIAQFDYSPSNPVVNQMITFDASAGDYNVKLTVTDKDGALDTETKRITVSGEEPIYVDDDFTDDPANHRWNTIQEGINDANDGDTVLVYNGTYYENVVLDNRLTLMGEGPPTIDAHSAGDAINITADNCTVKGFKCVNAYSSNPGNYAGIHVESSNNVIEDNTCKNNDMGIVLLTSSGNIIANNIAKNNEEVGITLNASNNNRITANDASNTIKYDGIYLGSSDNNEIANNTVNSNNFGGIRLYSHSNNNILTHNTANSNREAGILCWTASKNILTYKNYMGNYWSDYEGRDADGDGIGDDSYSIDEDKDEYPLMNPWENYFAP